MFFSQPWGFHSRFLPITKSNLIHNERNPNKTTRIAKVSHMGGVWTPKHRCILGLICRDLGDGRCHLANFNCWCSFGFLGAKHPETTNQKPMQPVKHLLNLRVCLNMKLLYTKIQVFLIIFDHFRTIFSYFFPVVICHLKGISPDIPHLLNVPRPSWRPAPWNRRTSWRCWGSWREKFQAVRMVTKLRQQWRWRDDQYGMLFYPHTHTYTHTHTYL